MLVQKCIALDVSVPDFTFYDMNTTSLTIGG